MTILLSDGVYEDVYLIKPFSEIIPAVRWCCDNVARGTWGTIGSRNISVEVMSRYAKDYPQGTVLAPYASSQWPDLLEDGFDEDPNLMFLGGFIFANPDDALLFKITWCGT